MYYIPSDAGFVQYDTLVRWLHVTGGIWQLDIRGTHVSGQSPRCCVQYTDPLAEACSIWQVIFLSKKTSHTLNNLPVTHACMDHL